MSNVVSDEYLTVNSRNLNSAVPRFIVIQTVLLAISYGVILVVLLGNKDVVVFQQSRNYFVSGVNRA